MDDKPHHIGTLSPEMALLGLLYKTPGHGYDLHRKVVSDLGEVWHLSQSQAYSILNRLVKQGDISSEEIVQDRLPSRQLLKITAQGQNRFEAWLQTTSGGSTRAIRLEFITRIYFLKMYMPDKIKNAFDNQKIEANANIDRINQILSETDKNQAFNLMSLDLRLKQLNAVLFWLDQFQPMFE